MALFAIRYSPFASFLSSPYRSPVLRDADADQLGIGQEYVGGEAAVVAVQEIAGDGGRR